MNEEIFDDENIVEDEDLVKYSSAEGMSQTMARENSLIIFSKMDASDSSLSSNCQTLTNKEKKKTLIEHNFN